MGEVPRPAGVCLWEQDSLGRLTKIGKIDKRPIVVSVFWANIADRRIAFIEPTSTLVDYDMVDQWCSTVFPNAVSFTNEANFHNIVHAIEDALNVKSLMARNHVFGLYTKHAPANPTTCCERKTSSRRPGSASHSSASRTKIYRRTLPTGDGERSS